jgi:hypothetical protein
MSLFEQKSLLAKLMATENMIVRQANVQTASFDVANRVLTVPVLDKNISKELYDLFMGHECGHALWTIMDGMKKAKEDKVNMSVLNVVEDSRIERKIKNKYPGIKSSFIKAYDELLQRNFFETEGKSLDSYNFIDRVNLHCKVGAVLALPFTEEEKVLLKAVESTETFEDAVELTKIICEFMDKQMDEEEQEVEIKANSGGDNGQPNSNETIPYEMEEKTEESSASEEPKDSNDDDSPSSSRSGSSGQDAGRHNKNKIESLTDKAYRENEHKLFSTEKKQYLYADVPKFDSKKIMDYKVVIEKMKAEEYYVNRDNFNEYKKESTKVVSYLVKEFELRKNAQQLKRAQTAKTGELNMSRLYSYQLTEDIFKKVTVMPEGKSHGLVMFVDWSASMNSHLRNTIKQLMNLVLFCKKVNIPYEVYCFIDETSHEYMYRGSYKEDELCIDNFGLINLLSSRMNSNDFTYVASALMGMCSRTGRIHTPSFLHMSGTPLNEAVIAAMEIVPQFQKQNRLQIVNTVFLTDGEGQNINNYTKDGLRQYMGYTNLVIRDPVTRHEVMYDARNRWSVTQTDCFINLLKARTNSRVIGFYVCNLSDIKHKFDYFWPQDDDYSDMSKRISDRTRQLEKIKEEFRKTSCVVVTSTGYDDYYVLRSAGLNTDDEDELEFNANATTRGMATAFSKFAGNKITSRVVLNRFIGLIS